MTALLMTAPLPIAAPDLIAFLRAAAARSFVWGNEDCCLLSCNWIMARRGVDPAARLRGRYADRAGCARILRHAGGLPALAATLALEAGLEATGDPRVGDVVLVRLDDRRSLFSYALGIRAGERCVFKAPLGLTGMSVPIIAAWSI